MAKLYEGAKIGRWALIELVKRKPNGLTWWRCRCECGTERVVNSSHLYSGKSKSCGCLQKEVASKVNSTHGMSHTVAFRRWKNMLSRCRNKNDKYYGGRGIGVCQRWLKFENFYEDMGDPPEALEIDRIDNSKGYSPENCAWKTHKENNRNTRYNRVIFYAGEKCTIGILSERFGIPYDCIRGRLDRGWSIETALSKKKYKGNKYYDSHGNQLRSIKRKRKPLKNQHDSSKVVTK